MEKKLHHYVPRFYLRAWAINDKVWCLQDGKILHTNVRNVAAQNHFCRLRELSQEDIDRIRRIAIDGSPEGLKSGHELLLRAFAAPHQAKRALEEAGLSMPEFQRQIALTIANANEDYHTTIENDFQPYLKLLLRGDLSFLDDQEGTVIFYRSIATQFLRTNPIRKIKKAFGDAGYEQYSRISNVLMQIFSVNLGFNLYSDRERCKIWLIDNFSEVPFITGDQPIINLAAHPRPDPDTFLPPEGFELYYPLSPRKALLILEPSSDFSPPSLNISGEAARIYNARIAAHSHQQVFSTKREQLLEVMEELPAYLSCFS